MGIENFVINDNKKNFFRLQSKNLKLTYPKKNSEGKSKIHSKEILHNSLLGKFKNKKAKILTLITAKEVSDEGYEHFHCYMNFDRKVDIRDSNFFDINSIHGEYASVKGSVRSYIEYCKKDGQYLIYDPGLNSNPEKENSLKSIMLHIVSQVRKWKLNKRYKTYNNLSYRELFYKSVSELNPADNAKICQNLEKCTNQFINIMRTRYGSSYDEHSSNYLKAQFHRLEEAEYWLQFEKHKLSLLLLGGSNLGKTEYAKSLLQPALLSRHIGQTKEFTPGFHKSLIIDDNSAIHKLSREETIVLLDRENDSTINVKHGHSVLPAGTPLILISNLSLSELFSDDCYEIIENCKVLKSEISRRIKHLSIQEDLRKLTKNENS